MLSCRFLFLAFNVPCCGQLVRWCCHDIVIFNSLPSSESVNERHGLMKRDGTCGQKGSDKKVGSNYSAGQKMAETMKFINNDKEKLV